MRRAILIAPVLAALVAAACAPAAAPRAASQPGQPRVVQIELQNFAFKPSRVAFKAGEVVTLKLLNPTTVEHDFAAGRQAQVNENGYREDFFKDVKLEVADGKILTDRASTGVRVEPGKTATVRFTVPERKGTYEIGCFVPGHYVSGMKGTLVIE